MSENLIVESIEKKEALIVKREELKDIIEYPCLDACLILYDKNIRTVASNANEKYAYWRNDRGGFFIHIDYESLSENNKKIAEMMEIRGLVDIKTNDKYGGINKKVIIKNKGYPKGGYFLLDKKEFIEQTVKIANMFEEQDVLYGRKTPEEALETISRIERISDREKKAFFAQKGFIDENSNINIEKIIEYVKTKKFPIIQRDRKFTDEYSTIYLGQIYDEETGEFWVNEELLEKHKRYVSKNASKKQEDDGR